MNDNELLSALSKLLDEKLDEKIKPIKDDINGIKTHLATIDARLDSMDDRLDDIDSNVSRTRNSILRQVKRVDEKIDMAFEDIGRVEKKLDKTAS